MRKIMTSLLLFSILFNFNCKKSEKNDESLMLLLLNAKQLMDVHGAGAQRSDPKNGDPANYASGHGPQGDVVYIYNCVRCLRGNSSASNTYAIIDTGQVNSYDNGTTGEITLSSGDPYYGQDAQNTGLTPDYNDNGDNTITDNVTGLM